MEKISIDKDLILSAQQGNSIALEQLFAHHKAWIFNIAIRMTGNPQEAEDLTQDVLLKATLKISGFQNKCSLRTWLYRIAVNTIIDMKRINRESHFFSFENHANLIDSMYDEEIADYKNNPDRNILIEETRLSCMMGMLLCLNRVQRLVFVLGGILGIDSKEGSEIMEMTSANFRQQLSRARKDLYNYMNNRCSLLHTGNPCSCARKTKAAIDAGLVDPENLKYYKNHIEKIKTVVKNRINEASLDEFSDLNVENIFQDQPFWNFCRELPHK